MRFQSPHPHEVRLVVSIAVVVDIAVSIRVLVRSTTYIIAYSLLPVKFRFTPRTERDA